MVIGNCIGCSNISTGKNHLRSSSTCQNRIGKRIEFRFGFNNTFATEFEKSFKHTQHSANHGWQHKFNILLSRDYRWPDENRQNPIRSKNGLRPRLRRNICLQVSFFSLAAWIRTCIKRIIFFVCLNIEACLRTDRLLLNVSYPNVTRWPTVKLNYCAMPISIPMFCDISVRYAMHIFLASSKTSLKCVTYKKREILRTLSVSFVIKYWDLQFFLLIRQVDHTFKLKLFQQPCFVNEKKCFY